MRIAVDFRKYHKILGGVEQMVTQLARFIAPQIDKLIMLIKEDKVSGAQELFKEDKNIKIVPLPVDTHSICKANKILDSGLIQDIAKQENCALVHFPYNWSFPSKKKVPTVLTIHDVIPFTFREAMSFFINHFRYRTGTRKACQLNDYVTTISEFSKRDIAKKTGIPLSKIKVIHNGLRASEKVDNKLIQELKDKFKLDGEYLLNVGGIHDRKNIGRLILAFSKLVHKYQYKGKLVITGDVSDGDYRIKKKQECDKIIASENIGDRIVFTGFIKDVEVDALFKEAFLFVYPSLYEGFGLPVLEAMRENVPVVTSNTSAMPEVTEDAALLIDPLNVDEMCEGMQKLVSDNDLRKSLITKGEKIVSKYSWKKTANEYLAFFKEIAGKV